MNWNNFILASYELILSITFSLVTVFLVRKWLSVKLLREKDENHTERTGNLALAIFAGTLILCTLLLVHSSFLPAVDTLNVVIQSADGFTLDILFTSFIYFLLFFAVSVSFSMGLIFLTTKVYTYATTEIDEMKELDNKNTAVAVILSIVILGTTITVQPALKRFIFSLVSYEQVEKITRRPLVPQKIQETKGQVVPKISKSKD
ncbi:DUF350 domain-containing protein [Sediminitomix flava]|uniref:Uncharacterized protein n=1 Tax=Sediminitomix flava TaxID=379075 RepID=A0A315ZVF0_SEDFL|nr:hypothetical protein [Sediminitomix flava]PWJ40189.1 hypothetical protein BC781_105257 [Sediminitomix flava]